MFATGMEREASMVVCNGMVILSATGGSLTGAG